MLGVGALCKIFALSVVLTLALASTAFAQLVPTLSINDVTVTEGDTGTTDARFTVTRSGNQTLISTVNFATANDTATQPSDYASTSGPLTFAAGETTKTVTVSVNGDTEDEADQKFFVNLSTAVNATISDNQGVGTIIDDDYTPQANDDGSAENPITLTEDDLGGVTTNVLNNDTGLGDTPIAVEVTTTPGKGTATVNADKTITYKPNANENGPDTYKYMVTDSDTQTSTATVFVQITPVNDAPTANNDNISVEEDGKKTFDPTSNDTKGPANEDGQEFAVDSIVTQPSHGTATLITSGPEAGKVSYVPNTNYNGPDSFTYEVCDDSTTDDQPDPKCDTATIDVTVTEVNDAPEAVPDEATTEEDTAKNIDVLANDSDADNSNADLKVASSSLSIPEHGTVEVITAGGPDKGKVRYTPNENYNGPDSFTYKVSDGDLNSNEATVSITVNPLNDAPTISDISDQATDEDVPTDTIPLTVRDVETAAADLTLTGSSDNADLVPDTNIEFSGVGEDRAVTVTPAPDRYGTVRITVKVSDGDGESASDSFVLTVRDKTPPEAPSVDLEAASDTGTSDTDNVTDDDTPTFAGHAEAGSEVAVYDGTALLGRVTAADNGDWSYVVPTESAFEEGEHRITATATDAAGNTSQASEALNVVVDRQVPNTFIDSSPKNPTNKTTAAFELSSSEQNTTFECSLDGGTFEPCSSPKEYSGLSDGDHAFEVQAIDAAGNVDPSPARRSWTVDTQGPEARLTAPEQEGALVRGAVVLRAEASDDLEVYAVQFLIDGTLVDTDLGAPPYEFEWDSTGVADGEHKLEARAIDTAGNETTSAARTVRVDNTPPDTLIDRSPNNPINSTTATFEFSSEEAGATFECFIDGVVFEPCSSPKEYGGLSDGKHLFGVRAVDEAGNRDETPAERVVIVDTEAPDAPTIESPAQSSRNNDGAFAVSGTAEPASQVRLLEGEELVGTTKTGDGGGWSVEVTEAPDGQHTYTATATDAAGNTSEWSEGRTVIVDTAPPMVTGVIPDRDQVGVPINTGVEAVFSKDMDEATLDGNFVLTEDGAIDPVEATVSYDASTNTAILDPNANLDHGTVYTAKIEGGQDSVKDLAGNSLAAGETWSFTTAGELDTTPPAAPTIESPEERYDDDGAFGISGTAEPGSWVRLFEGADLVGDAIAGADGGGWSITLRDVPEGRHAYAATATDAAGNESARSEERTVIVDLTNPDALIDSSPANFVNDTKATFRFSSDEQNTSFECSLDGGPFEPCSSPKDYSGLSDGLHTFEVRAIDAAGNVDPSPARRSWTVDTEGPQSRLTAPAEGALVRGEVVLRAEASDNLEVEKVRFLVDGEVVDVPPSAPYDFGWGSTGVADGAHKVEAQAIDAAGNEATSAPRTVQVNNTAPDTYIEQSPDTTGSTVSFGFFSVDKDVSYFECSLDSGPSGTPPSVDFERCSSPAEYRNLLEGAYTFRVRAVDEAGNVDDTPAERRFNTDTTAPFASVISSGPSDLVGSRSAIFGFYYGHEESITFECRLDGGPFEPCEPPKWYDGLSDGTHAFEVRAIDAVGNRGAVVERVWTVDATAPGAPTIAGPANNTRNNTGSFAVSGTAEANSTVLLFEGETSVGTARAGADGRWSVSLAGVAQGSHTYVARATDAAGNTSAVSKAQTVIVDTTAPTVTTATPAGKKVSAKTRVTATFSEPMNEATVEALGTFTLNQGTKEVSARVDYDPATRKATLYSARKLTSGATYTATVTTGAKDLAGNALAVNKVWKFRVR